MGSEAASAAAAATRLLGVVVNQVSIKSAWLHGSVHQSVVPLSAVARLVFSG